MIVRLCNLRALLLSHPNLRLTAVGGSVSGYPPATGPQ